MRAASRFGLIAGTFASLMIATAAVAQLASPRIWPELKEAVQERADRNAYPMTGMKAGDVREILSHINSLDRDEWAAGWMSMGSRYAAEAAKLEPTDKSAARDAYLMAFRYAAFGAWPTQNSPGKKESLHCCRDRLPQIRGLDRSAD